MILSLQKLKLRPCQVHLVLTRNRPLAQQRLQGFLRLEGFTNCMSAIQALSSNSLTMSASSKGDSVSSQEQNLQKAMLTLLRPCLSVQRVFANRDVQRPTDTHRKSSEKRVRLPLGFFWPQGCVSQSSTVANPLRQRSILSPGYKFSGSSAFKSTAILSLSSNRRRRKEASVRSPSIANCRKI